MIRRQVICALMAAGFASAGYSAQAMTNSQLARQSMIKISNAASQSENVLSVDELEQMPTATLATVTPWTDGAVEFEGIYMVDIVERFGDAATVGKAMAFNDYQIEFEIADVIEKGGFVAFKRDGEPLSRRDKGPFWLVFPWSERPELDTRAVHGLSIWQLVDLTFE